MTDVTRILDQLDAGDDAASDQLYTILYAELRALASRKLSGESPGQTLQATALVHEVYLKLAGSSAGSSGRGHFYRTAAEAMRRILVDRARARGAAKRGGGWRRLTLEGATLAADDSPEGVLELDGALAALRSRYPIHAELVSLRFYSGLALREASDLLGLAPTTADRRWEFARAWLAKYLEES